MPFAKRAKVMLRNDTDKDVMNYSYVEWEPLEKWSEQLGYFHATWRRQVFQLSKDTESGVLSRPGLGPYPGTTIQRGDRRATVSEFQRRDGRK